MGYIIERLPELTSEQDKERRRLIRIAISDPHSYEGTASRMARDGWTVERVAEASLEELYKYSYSDGISRIWKENAIRYPTVKWSTEL